MVSTAKLQSPQHMREQFFGRRLLPISPTVWLRFRPSAHRRLVSPSGATSQLNGAVCPSAACSPASGAKVPHALALRAVRPAAASVRFCAVASHSAGITQSRLAPPLLGVLTKAGYSEPSLSSAQQTFRQANGLEHPVQQAAEFLGFSWRPNRPLPNMLFKGTPTRFAVCLPLTPALDVMKSNRVHHTSP
jgi:hypothetical protein